MRGVEAMRRIVFGTALLATLGSCAMKRYDAGKEESYFEKAPVCCQSPAEFHFEPAPDGILPATFDLDEHSPAFEFPTGKSPFGAFELPKADAPRLLKVTGYELYNPRGEKRVFFPLVMLLDRDKRPLRATGWNEMVFYEGHIEVPVPFGGPGDSAAYAVVYTAPELVNAQAPATASRIGLLPIGRSIVAAPMGFDYTSRYGAYFGHLAITIGSP
jgi:hypothetical protein